MFIAGIDGGGIDGANCCGWNDVTSATFTYAKAFGAWKLVFGMAGAPAFGVGMNAWTFAFGLNEATFVLKSPGALKLVGSYSF